MSEYAEGGNSNY